jgi:hypothetical protein
VAGLVAQTPATRNPSLRAVWTPSSDAPPKLLTAVQSANHDSFIDKARAGKVWDQAFGSLKAANFGSGGTHSDGLLWRMQNGELDGYEAKLIVLHGVGITSSGGPPIGNIGDLPIGDRQAEFVAGYARLIAEIRARQPQAKILILPPFPRGRLRREEWRAVAGANAVARVQGVGGRASALARSIRTLADSVAYTFTGRKSRI